MGVTLSSTGTMQCKTDSVNIGDMAALFELITNKSVTTRACLIYFTRYSVSDYMFRLSSLDHHQVVSYYLFIFI